MRPESKNQPVEHKENQVIHTYDGIEEYDNRLPLWWQYTLYGAVVFALVYWFDYSVFKIHPSPKGELDEEVAALNAAAAERARAAGPVTDEMLETLAKDNKSLADGKATFTTICAACHRADGGGNIGPNLTDEYWIHGNKPTDIYKNVTEGVVTKGMPAWGPQLGPQKVSNVVAYVLTLKNTNVPDGKAPQGERMQ